MVRLRGTAPQSSVSSASFIRLSTLAYLTFCLKKKKELREKPYSL